MKDITTTSFGLLIAFFLPGLAGFYSLTFWWDSVKILFNTFLTAQSNVGLFFLVIGGALIIGLQITLFRWIIFECIICRKYRLKPTAFEKLGTSKDKLEAFGEVVNAHYRYHQFWGGLSITIPIFFFGLYLTSSCDWTSYKKGWAIAAAIVIEIVTISGAIQAYINYTNRGKKILDGG